MLATDHNGGTIASVTVDQAGKKEPQSDEPSVLRSGNAVIRVSCLRTRAVVVGS